jgi:4-amino-4-deoxy-L-arabinose transferase-like glycosyltransferase
MSLSSRRRLLVLAVVATLVGIAGWFHENRARGLALRLTTPEGALIAALPHAGLHAFRVDAYLAPQPRPIVAEWAGYWDVPPSGVSELVLKTDGAARVYLDGALIVETARKGGARALTPVAAGSHSLRMEYRPSDRGPREVFLKGVTTEGISIVAERRGLSTSPRTASDRLLYRVGQIFGLLGVLSFAILAGLAFRDGGHGSRIAVGCALLFVIAFALRSEALVFTYWGQTGPAWAENLASQIRSARSGSFEHAPATLPYAGDPFSYLGIARAMTGFYEPSAREPLFPALVQVALRLVHDDDIGINFVSAISSALVCLAIFAIGLQLRSPWTGFAAALLWALEWQTILFSVEGWRDDLFTLEVAACAAALIALYRDPGRRHAMVFGALAGLTLLTRLSAFSFILPSLGLAILLPGEKERKVRLRAGAEAIALMLLIAGPFMWACAIGYGDPFYAVNVHTRFYRSRAGLADAAPTNVLSMFTELLAPWEFVRTGFLGFTSVPFESKWSGFDAFLPGLVKVLPILALGGLAALMLRPEGWILLSILFCSILPYAWTWNIRGGGEWRFTLPAYPFYLISAALVATECVQGVRRLADKSSRSESWRYFLRIAVAATAVFLAITFLGRWFEWAAARERIESGKEVTLAAASGSSAFFRSGWQALESGSGYRMRGAEATLELPRSNAGATRVVLRFGAVPPTPVQVFEGDRWLATLDGRSGRDGVETFDLSRDSSSRSTIELRFVTADASLEAVPFTLLWVRVGPEPAAR